MKTIDADKKVSSRRLPPEEIERRKNAFRNYVLLHPDLTLREIWNNRTLLRMIDPSYGFKVELAIYDAITNNKNPKNVPAENFRPLVSYIASKICFRIRKNGLQPSFRDMKQDGIIGVLYAQNRVREDSNLKNRTSYFCTSIRARIWKGLENSFSFVSPPHEGGYVLKWLTFLHKYDFSAQEAREIKGEEILSRYSNELIDSQANLWKARNLGLGKLRDIPYKSYEAVRDDLSLVRKDLDYVMGCLSEREKEIILLRSEGKKLEEVGDNQSIPITRERVRQIEKRALGKLKDCIKILLETRLHPK